MDVASVWLGYLSAIDQQCQPCLAIVTKPWQQETSVAKNINVKSLSLYYSEAQLVPFSTTTNQQAPVWRFTSCVLSNSCSKCRLLVCSWNQPTADSKLWSSCCYLQKTESRGSPIQCDLKAHKGCKIAHAGGHEYENERNKLTDWLHHKLCACRLCLCTHPIQPRNQCSCSPTGLEEANLFLCVLNLKASNVLSLVKYKPFKPRRQHSIDP